ncbi:response regulator [Ramlibacter rhizophilus]|uniref:response regulator n=1 Tax=Ramlibacter rhizophilus TaxID=1781167 RepID=UPI0014326B35|nr:response regulator [Ramlibacter rhizophilus]
MLVVDDDALARLALGGLLANIPGVEIVEAEDGQAAWEMLQAGLRPALCCTDLVMPRLDGLGLMEKVRAEPFGADLPFVLITGAADRSSLQGALRQRADGFIVKPFSAPQTRATVERILRASRPRRPSPPQR